MEAEQPLEDDNPFPYALLDTVLDAVPAMVFYKDTHNRLLRVNHTLAERLGLPRSAIEGRFVNDLFPEYADAYWADDREVIASGCAKRGIRECIPTPEGIRWLQTDKVPYRDDQGNIIGIVGFAIDITEQKLVEDALNRRDAILEAVGFAAQRLLATGTWSERIQEVLARLGQAAEVSRAYIFENHPGPDGGLLTSQRYEWVAPGIMPQIGNPALQNFSYRDGGFARWECQLARGDLIYGPISDLPPDEREFLGSQSIQSIVVVPIWVHDTWWGFIGFDDCSTPRQWSRAEREALRAAAGTVGAAIQRAQAERELHRLNQSLQGIIDNASVWLSVVDKSGAITIWNRAAEEISGYTREEVQGEHGIWHRLFPDEAALQRTIAAVRQARRQGKVLEGYETTIRRRDGQSRIMSWTIRNLIDAQGELASILFLGQDITERKRADEALRRSNEKLSLLADAATRLVGLPDAEASYQFVADRLCQLADAMVVTVSTYNPENNLLTVQAIAGLNEATAAVLIGYAPIGATYSVSSPETLQEMMAGQLLGIPGVYQLGLERIGRECAEALERLLAVGAIYGIGLVQGSRLLGCATIVLPKGQELDSPSLIEAFAHQATIWLLRQEAERGLRESEARFRNLFQNIGDAFVLLDDELCVVDLNDLSRDLLGCKGQLRGRSFVEGFDLPEKSGMKALLEGVLRSGITRQNVEIRLPRAEGKREQDVYLTMTVYRIYVADAPHVALLCRDVSEKRRLEEEVQRARRLEALARFAFGVAHDFGNFLAIIRGEAELLREHVLTGRDMQEHADTIVRVVEDASSLTGQLLAFSRGETVQPEILHLHVLIERSQRLLRGLLGDRITLQLDLADQPIFFWGDRGQFDRVLLNLISNARDAMPEGGSLIIRTRLEDIQGAEANRLGLDPGLYAVMAVGDTGEGMDRETLLHIFDPFFTTKSKDGRAGMGLGLSVVYGIMQQQNGQISVESQPGQGATFYLYFPAVVVEDWMLDEGDSMPPPGE